MSNNIKVTVFTPTYNRGYIIGKLYYSLLNQTCKDFEWLVIDDGSNDNTQELIEEYIDEGKIPIRYKKVKNGGKCRAINKGVALSEACLFYIVDSDDYLPPNAIERILYWESTIIEKKDFAGVAGNRGNYAGKIWGTTFTGESMDCTSLDAKKRNVSGDKAEVYYTDLLRKYPFPEIEGERYIPLDYVWLGIAYDGYKLRWFNEVIYCGEYLEDGLTNKYQELLDRNPKGYAIYKNKECLYLNYRYKQKINSYYQYYTRFKDRLLVKEIAANLHISEWKMYLIIFRFKVRDLIKGKSY